MRFNGLIKFASALFLAVYLAAVAGFDIHNCSDNGKVYFEPLFAGISCEDIHPDTPCHHHHHDCDCPESCHCDECEECCGCDEDEDCCSDCIGILTFCGENHSYFPSLSFVAAFQALVADPAASVCDASSRLVSSTRDLSSRPPGDILFRNCVLRV